MPCTWFYFCFIYWIWTSLLKDGAVTLTKHNFNVTALCPSNEHTKLKHWVIINHLINWVSRLVFISISMTLKVIKHVYKLIFVNNWDEKCIRNIGNEWNTFTPFVHFCKLTKIRYRTFKVSKKYCTSTRTPKNDRYPALRNH